jgi:nucleoside-diphosphate-sugar epimerase
LQSNIGAALSGTEAVFVATEKIYGYGVVDGPLHEGLPLTATTRKGVVRAELGRELERAHNAGDYRTVAARASDVYGPGVENSAYGNRFFGPLIAGKKTEVLGDPSARHTVTYVPDLGRAMIRLGQDPDAWGKAWHIPNAPAPTTEELVTYAARIAGTTPQMARIRPLKMRLAGLFIPAAKEMIELAYEFDRDFVVDDSTYTDRCGSEFTELEEACHKPSSGIEPSPTTSDRWRVSSSTGSQLPADRSRSAELPSKPLRRRTPAPRVKRR